MKTVEDYLAWGEEQFINNNLFFGHGTDNAWDEAVALVSFVMNFAPDVDRSVLEQEVTPEQGERIISLYEKRIFDKIPAPYLTGVAWFCGLPFRVDERVIVPRSPIGELIQSGFQPWLTTPPATVLDLCCGSGCIGIAAGYAFPDARITLSDISPEALAVAQENVAHHEMQGRAVAVESDGLSELVGQTFDLIVSNPPYVDACDFAEMPEEYHREPKLALVSGDDGLDFTRNLLKHAAQFLTDDGWLFVEVGNSWQALEQSYPDVPFTWVEFEQGGHGVFCLSRDQLVRHFTG